MAKKLVSVWLSLTILLFSSISIYAEEYVQGDFFIKKIVINGETIDNNNLQFPFFLYKDSTYVPLTPEMAQIMGLIVETDFESRTIKLLKTEPSLVNISDNWKKNERKDISLEILGKAQVLVYELEPQSLAKTLKAYGSADEEADIDAEADAGKETQKDGGPTDTGEAAGQATEGAIETATFNEIIEIPELSVRELDLEGRPVLTRGSTIYLPLRALAGENGFGWDVYYDSYTGIYASTVEGVPAASYWNEAESKYNQGLVNYIRKSNGKYTESKAQELVFMFKHAAKTYNISEKILMAVACKESTFNAKSKSGSGSLGMMQVMPSTGARYGLGSEQLLDAEISINFGAMYLSERIAAYGGNLTKGFSAYNQGSVSVNRGTYSTRYATRVIDTINSIDHYLTSNGYGLGY